MSTKYYPTIGLEVHAELATKSKMFCGCVNDPGEKRPNWNVCPVCMAHPGTLPVANKKAIEYMIKIGLAVGGTIADYTEFDRKNYFYPDIPKGYQITQYKNPVVVGGELAGVKLTRIHLEEDTGTSKHDRGDYSLVDYNRAGIPLMELVTEPVIHDAETATRFAKELQLLLRYLGVASADMENGEMRVDVNVSVSADPNKLGTKAEIKNMNSFSAVGKAIAYELGRMEQLLSEGKGNEIAQETRGWNDAKGQTFSQRKKEYANDYRYFPDPDLPPLYLSQMFDVGAMKKSLPELPWQKRERYKKEFGIKDEDIEAYVTSMELGEYFEDVITKLPKGDTKAVKLASNYITSDLVGHMKNNESFVFPRAELFSELIDMVSGAEVSSRGAKDILEILHEENRSPMEIAKEKGLLQQNDEESLKKIVQGVVDTNQKIVADYKEGKEAALMSLVGQVMKATKGSANPQLAQKVLKELL